MQDNAFTPFGFTYMVSGAPVQVLTTNNQAATSYRVSNLTASRAYIAWAAPLASKAVPGMAVPAAPAIGSVTTAGVGMIATSVEVFCLPANAWFLGSTGSTFEVTPGEGV